MTLWATVCAVSSGSDYYGPPGGEVAFSDATTNTPLGTADVAGCGSAGVASVTVPFLWVGAHDIIATYEGGGCCAGSTSPSVSQEVDPATSSTTLASIPAYTASFGYPVNFTATVTGEYGGQPTAQVSFYDETTDTLLGQASPNGSGQAVLATSSLPSGSQTIMASFEGDACLLASQSSTVRSPSCP